MVHKAPRLAAFRLNGFGRTDTGFIQMNIQTERHPAAADTSLAMTQADKTLTLANTSRLLAILVEITNKGTDESHRPFDSSTMSH